VKSSAPLAVTGVLACILMAGCVQLAKRNVPSPPATSYRVGSFELQESGSSQKVSRAVSYHCLFSEGENSDFARRGFLPEEYGSGTQQVVMVSHRLWQDAISWGPTNNRHLAYE